MTKHPTYTMHCEHDFELDDFELVDASLTVTYNYWPGEKGVNTLPNGDPGYPDNDPEIEVLTCVLSEDYEAVYLDKDGSDVSQTFKAGMDVSSYVDEDLIIEMCFYDASARESDACDEAAADRWEARKERGL